MTETELLNQAIALHQQGRLSEALALYQQVLSQCSDVVDALHFGALASAGLGQADRSAQMLGRAIELEPGNPSLHNNLGEILRMNGRLDQAVASYDRAIALSPKLPAAHNNLGIALRAMGRTADAIAHFRAALAEKPDYAEAHCNLGDALHAAGDPVAARAALERSVALNPALPQGWNNLGNLLRISEPIRAIECYRRAIAVAPHILDAYNNLAATLHNQGQLIEAIDVFRQALAIAPNSREIHTNLSIVLGEIGLADDAVEHARHAVVLAPNGVEQQNNLARAFVVRGEYENAIAAYRRAVQLAPQFADIGSNVLLTLNYRAINPAAMRDEHFAWAKRHVVPSAPVGFSNSRDPDRRLRIGLVSSDFREHAAAHFIEPVLVSPPDECELFCYSASSAEDEATRCLRAFGHAWRPIASADDVRAEQLVREDRIDILIDLNGHTAGHRLGLFAREPAPVQITWLGYPNTTGMRQLDAWITDPYLDPPGQTDEYCSEQLLRLPETFACYAPPRESPEVNELPAAQRGFVTFGSFNNFIKISDEVLRLWLQILERIPTARMVIGTQRLASGQGLGPMTERMRKLGLPLDRIRFEPGRSKAEYLASHHEIDMLLDTFPFTGHTITLHALWMGVPVVTLAGQSHVARRGVSILHNLGLPELIAATPEEYATMACSLASDLGRLAELRRGLRARMSASPLSDAPRFARNLSVALRGIWQQWCRG